MPTDTYQLFQIAMSSIQQVNGLGMNRRGGAGIRTAREASIIESGTRIKTDEKVDAVADFCQRDMEILVRMVRGVADSDYVFYRRGEVGPQAWTKFTMQDADWTPDVRIRVNSFREDLKSERIEHYMALLEIGAQLFPIYGPKVRLDVLYRRLLEDTEIPNPMEIMGDAVTEEMFQMIELVMLSNGQEAPVLPDHGHRLHRATIEDFMQTQAFKTLPPPRQDAIIQHYEQHIEFEQQNSQNAPQVTNPRQPFGNESENRAEAQLNSTTDAAPIPAGFSPGGVQ